MSLLGLFGGDTSNKQDSTANIKTNTTTTTRTNIVGVGSDITSLLSHVSDTSAAQVATANQLVALALIRSGQQPQPAPVVVSPQPAGASLSTWLGIAASALVVYSYLRK